MCIIMDGLFPFVCNNTYTARFLVFMKKNYNSNFKFALQPVAFVKFSSVHLFLYAIWHIRFIIQSITTQLHIIQ